MGRPSVNWPSGGSAAWRAVRRQVLIADGWRCRVAAFKAGEWSHPRLDAAEAYRANLTVSPKCTGGDRTKLSAHHILGRGVTGDNPRWIITACMPCNQANGNPAKAADPQPREVMW